MNTKAEAIKSRLDKYKEPESPRSKQVRETNERMHNEGLKIVARDRHERRHGNGKRTSKAQALESAMQFSKER